MNHITSIGITTAVIIMAANGVSATQIEPRIDSKPRIDIFELRMFPGWFQPICAVQSYKGSTRLVVQLMKDGSAVLNPKGELGIPPDAIDLKGLTLENARMVWGEPRGMTFDLLANPRARSCDRDVYHLDTRFVNGELSAYRLRGIDIVHPEWKDVDSGTDHAAPEP